jgi:hypothetical protein
MGAVFRTAILIIQSFRPMNCAGAVPSPAIKTHKITNYMNDEIAPETMQEQAEYMQEWLQHALGRSSTAPGIAHASTKTLKMPLFLPA